ncbi:hypothetical protein CYMTET_10337 [Cymbomonas tetramitiformis]|uniref:Uncharacterized protein n=1 Tax=Cymbomonas tetramitiformis TaxID=36881 RepID=A0AAE0LDY1_9CHLO|nr:hypothetical protein CYMTET_10337 [Cymbomonas tetramitiformis]
MCEGEGVTTEKECDASFREPTEQATQPSAAADGLHAQGEETPQSPTGFYMTKSMLKPSHVSLHLNPIVNLEPTRVHAMDVEPSSLPSATQKLLSFFTLCVRTERDPSRRLTTQQLDTTRFLLALYGVDAFSWGVGSIFSYELVELAEDMDLCYLYIALSMAAAEILIEFAASSMTPHLFTYLTDIESLNPRGLVAFATHAYAFSNLVALAVYPPLFLIIYIAGFKNIAVLILLAATRTIQYAFLNQIGDAAIEMSIVGWLATFSGSAHPAAATSARDAPSLKLRSGLLLPSVKCFL